MGVSVELFVLYFCDFTAVHIALSFAHLTDKIKH